MANTSVSLVDLDFETIKTNLKNYLKRSDSPFKDVDFEGSNVSQLLDVLSYNTYLNSYYLNMVGSEMFLDTAALRDSVVSHAKELNYVPRSFRSAEAQISFNVTPSIPMTALIIPKGTSFTAKVGSNNYSFTTNDSTVVSISNNVFSANLTIYEGSYVTDSFIYNSSNTSQRFVLSNSTVDTRSITTIIIEDNGASTLIYTKASSFLGLTDTSQSYFLQAAENAQYEIVFGDDVVGRRPKNGAVVSIEYRVSNGELPNGARTFDVDGSISGQANISSITTITPAAGGAVNETIESIKFNAPRHYQNQERAITASDFETLLLANFPEIQAVAAYGGEDADPPQYGKVFIAVDDFNIDGASESSKAKYNKFIKARSPLAIDPVFIDPDFIYVEVQCLVRYNTNLTTLQTSDISTLIQTTVSTYNTNKLNGFKKTLRYSKLLEDLNNSQDSIVSVDLYTVPYKKLFVVPEVEYSRIIDFGFPLSSTYTISYDDIVEANIKAVYSMNFTYAGRLCNIQDDRAGKIGIYTADGEDKNTLLINIGSVDYTAGRVVIESLTVSSYTHTGGHFNLFVNPLEKDISTTKNYILTIPDDDILVNVVAIQE